MLTNKAKYGLKALLYLAARPDRPALISEIAEHESIPKKFLDIILLDLKNSGLLASKKGKGGGYQLARQPAQIMVGNVVRILDGPLAPIACVSRTAYRPCPDCRSESACKVRAVMSDVRDAIANILDNTSLSDMAARADRQDNGYMYHI
ncbi:MAG: Rrf2 family transcriptional regulator [Rhodospirillales bacterium]|nr:MAG: Rrf2 family transcriptional regulator [Rhodospirillales bacterium]